MQEKLENSRPSASSFSRSLEQFFLTVGQNNFGNKIPFLSKIHYTKAELLQLNDIQFIIYLPEKS